MLTSVNKKIFKIVLDILNDNEHDVIFDGNFMFKFHQQPTTKVQDFHILKTQDNTLEVGTDNVVPVVNVENVEIPFNEKNKRSDWEATYWISIKIPEDVDLANNVIYEFDEEDDRYQAMMEAYQELKNTLSFDGEGIRASFKVREPQKVNVFRHEGNYYQVFAFGFNVVKIEQGYFGNDMDLYIGEADDNDFGKKDDYLADTISVQMIISKRVQDDTYGDEVDVSTRPVKRDYEYKVFANYRSPDITADKLLMDECMGVATPVGKKYKVLIDDEEYEIERTMTVQDTHKEYKNNKVQQMNMTFKSIRE